MRLVTSLFRFLKSIRQMSTCVAAGLFLLGEAKTGAIPLTLSQFSATDPTINFNTGTTLLPNIPGIHFYGGSGNWLNGGFGPQVFENTLSAGGYSYIGIIFDTPQQAVGSQIHKLVPAMTGLTEVVFDSGGNVLESESANFSAGLLGIGVPGAQISKVEWRYSTPGWIAVSDVIYGTSPAVPEQTSTLMLLALACLALAVPLRKCSVANEKRRCRYGAGIW